MGTLVSLPIANDDYARTSALARAEGWHSVTPAVSRAVIEYDGVKGIVSVRRVQQPDPAGRWIAHVELDDGRVVDAAGRSFDGALTRLRRALELSDHVAAE